MGIFQSTLAAAHFNIPSRAATFDLPCDLPSISRTSTPLISSALLIRPRLRHPAKTTDVNGIISLVICAARGAAFCKRVDVMLRPAAMPQLLTTAAV